MLSTTEQSLKRRFTEAVADGSATDCTEDGAVVIGRVKKIRDYAFIHFRDRQLALLAMERLNGLLSLSLSPDISYCGRTGNERLKN